MYISEDYKEFLIESFSLAINNKYFDEIVVLSRNTFSNEVLYRAIPEERSNFINRNGNYLYLDEYEELAFAIVLNQKIPPLYENLFNPYAKGYKSVVSQVLEETGIVLSIKEKVWDKKTYRVLIKTREQFEQVLEILKANNDQRTYIEIIYETNKDIIANRSIERENKKQDDREREIEKENILKRERKKRIAREAKEELIKEGLIFNERKKSEGSREPIPQEVMDRVWNRDGGACVKCGSRENLEFDHIIPYSKGGATTYRNLQLLCQKCNREKSDKIG